MTRALSRLPAMATLFTWIDQRKKRLARLEEARQRRTIARSGLFDGDWYRKTDPDVATHSEDLLTHYLRVGAAEGRDPNPLFDTDWYLRHYPEVATAKLNPLVHYIRTGAAEDRDPGPFFDTDWYRAQYLGAAEKQNPLAHYLQDGMPARRDPRPDFDADFYLRQLPAQERALCDVPLLHFRSIGRERGYQANPRDWIVERCGNGRPTLLMVSHNAGGGTAKHVHDLIGVCCSRVNVLLLEPRAPPWVTVTWAAPEGGARLSFDAREDLPGLAQFLKDCAVSRLHIHHFYRNEHYLRQLVGALAVPFDFTVHDYYALAPQPHLAGRDGIFVGEDLLAAEPKLLRGGFSPTQPRSLAGWQAECRWLLTEAARVIVPSRDVRQRLSSHVPGIATILAAPPLTAGDAPPVPASLASREPLRVGLIGALGPHKGLRLLLACARLAKAGRQPLEFVVIGSVDRRHERELRDLGVTITGAYKSSDLTGLTADLRPALLWYPSQVPETFSYTLSEGMALRLPIAVVDLGALPERVGARAWTWVKPCSMDAAQWVEFFLDIRARHFLTGGPPAPNGPAWDVTDEFYRMEYLSWLAAPR